MVVKARGLFQGLHVLLRTSCFSVALVAFLYTLPLAAKQTEPAKTILKIAQVDWCPQICIYEDDPGYIIEILDEVFAGSHFDLVYSTYPWSRAIAHTLNGQTVALLAAAPKEAPGLLFPENPIGEQQACFYTLPVSGWRYTTKDSLDNVRIGLPAHISLEELNDYKKEHAGQFHIQASTPRYIDLSIKMLNSNRLDTFVFFRNTMTYHLRRFYTEDTVTRAGCVTATPVYIVFSPAAKVSELSKAALAYYEMRIRQMKKAGRITQIMARYGLPDWSTHY